MDPEITKYIDKKFEEHRRLEETRVNGNKELSHSYRENHRHQHYAEERSHAELHAVHEEAHKREHEAAEVAVLKTENLLQQRLQEMNDFKESIQLDIGNFISAKYLESKLENFVRHDEFASVRALVYGAVGIVMTAFLGALVTLVVVGS
jgi:hypothetical protein